MSTIKSQSEITAGQSQNFFKPGLAEVTLYLLLSVVILLVFNAGGIIQKLSNNYIGSPEHLQANFTNLSNSFSHTFSSALGGRLGQIVLWSFVGALAYIGLWAAKNVLNSFENDIISDHYLHPSTYSRAGYWGSSFSVKIFLVALLMVTVAFLFVTITAILPSVTALAGSAAYNFHVSSSPLYIVFSVVAIALVIYTIVVLWRLLAHLWKLL